MPLYEAKLVHQFDSRFATFVIDKNGKTDTRQVADEEKTSDFVVNPRYWLRPSDVGKKLSIMDYKKHWLFGFRDIASATNERTLITSVLKSSYGYGHTEPLIMLNEINERASACLLANLNSLVTDYLVRLKVTGTHVSFFILKQIPILPPDSYSGEEVEFIASRVAKLTRNHDSINKVWLTDYPEYPFGTAESRLEIRAELDALYAKKYGLTRNELEFVLDPSDSESPDYPSVTFPGLKKNEIKLYGEFRTRRLVLEAFDKLEKYGLEAFEVAK